MVDIQTISIVIASASVVAGVLYYVLQILHQTRMRQTDLVMRLYSTFAGREFQDAWYRVRTSDVSSFRNVFDYPQELFIATNQMCLFFEGIGILLQRGLTDTKMIEDLFGGTVARAWEQVRIGVTTARQQFDDPTIYWYFEYLYNEVKKREQKLQSKT